MKVLSFLFLLLLFENAYSQNNNEIFVVSNSQNQQYFPFDQLKRKGKSYTIILNIISSGLGKFSNQHAVIKDIKNVTSTFEFELMEQSEVLFSYPINEKRFNYKYYYKRVYPLSGSFLKVCLKLSFLEEDEKVPVMIIDKIKVLND